MRAYIDKQYADNPDRKTLSTYFQIDYKIDNGPWQYTSTWDSPEGSRFVLSPWSKEYTLSANVVQDYNKLINHAPKLLSISTVLFRM